MTITMPDPDPGRCGNYRMIDGKSVRCLDYENVRHVCSFESPAQGLPELQMHTYSVPVPKPWVKPTRPVTVHFNDGPWDGEAVEVNNCTTVFAVGHQIGNHYWLDTKSDPPMYHWDGTPWEFTDHEQRQTSNEEN